MRRIFCRAECWTDLQEGGFMSSKLLRSQCFSASWRWGGDWSGIDNTIVVVLILWSGKTQISELCMTSESWFQHAYAGNPYFKADELASKRNSKRMENDRVSSILAQNETIPLYSDFDDFDQFRRVHCRSYMFFCSETCVENIMRPVKKGPGVTRECVYYWCTDEIWLWTWHAECIWKCVILPPTIVQRRNTNLE